MVVAVLRLEANTSAQREWNREERLESIVRNFPFIQTEAGMKEEEVCWKLYIPFGVSLSNVSLLHNDIKTRQRFAKSPNPVSHWALVPGVA